MWIMIAGLYRSGAVSDAEREDNLRCLHRLALEVFRKGHVASSASTWRCP